MRKTKEDTEISKSAILLAAEEEFCRYGFSAANMDSIAKAVGMTKGAIFWHFQSKIGLFRAVLNQSLHQIQAIAAEVLASSKTMRSMEVCREIIKRLGKNRNTMNLFLGLVDAVKTGTFPQDLFDEYYRAINEIIQSALREFSKMQERGELGEEADPETILLTITVVMFGFAKLNEFITSRRPDERLRHPIRYESIIDAVFDGLLSFQAVKK